MARRAELDRGRGLRAKCKSSRKTTWRETITNANRIIHLKMSIKDLREVLFLSYEENMISVEEFLLLFDEYSSKNPEFEPLVSTWELAFWSPWPQLKNVLTCAVAVMLQKYFRLASVVSLFFVYTAHKQCSFALQKKFGRQVEFLNQSCR